MTGSETKPCWAVFSARMAREIMSSVRQGNALLLVLKLAIDKACLAINESEWSALTRILHMLVWTMMNSTEHSLDWVTIKVKGRIVLWWHNVIFSN